MSEHLINSLQTVAQNSLNVLRDMFKMMQKAIKTIESLPELIQTLINAVTNGFRDQIQAQGEMELQMRIANLESKGKLIQAELEAINDFENNLNEDAGVVAERFHRTQNELNTEAEKRIKELDAHLFDLNDVHFPIEMFRAQSEKTKPELANIFKDSFDSYAERAALLNDKISVCNEHLNAFYNTRKEFFNKIDGYVIKEGDPDEEEYLLPVWVIETEDRLGGNNNMRAYLPGKFNIASEGSLQKSRSQYFCHDDLDELNSILNSRETMDRMQREIVWKEDAYINETLTDRMKHFVDFYFKDSMFKSAAKAFHKIIDESQIQTAQGVKHGTH